jgi:alpha-glucosidase
MKPSKPSTDPFIVPGHGDIKRRWTDGALVYHIYPRSFMDSNGDGIGDLRGIASRLDYLKSLGVNVIWLSPFYPSPMADFGYDVADYCDVDPMFGTLDDFKHLIAEAQQQDIRVMIDLVPNHTSDEHKWFRESRKSQNETNPFRDWYVWRDGVPVPESQQTEEAQDGAAPSVQRPGVPNNWRDALTGGPAWEWCDERQQYFLHSFDVRQPDLNWGNPAVRAAVKSAMRFWLDMGVDGFRVDAVYWMAKEPLLSDDPGNPDFVEGEDLPYHALRHDNSRGWPAVYAYLSEMADVLHEEKYGDKQRFMVTEAYPEGHNPLVEYLNFYVGMDPEVAAPFNFEGLSMPWEAAAWRKFLRAFHNALDQIDPHCVPSYAFGNHDKPRIASRIGDASARSAAILLLTLPGMVFLYYGDELGMKDVVIPPEMVQDPAAKGDVTRGDLHPQGRDPQRTPMQWTVGRNAGFSEGDKTWLPVAPNYQKQNVEAEMADEGSLLRLYQTLGQLRASSASIKHGHIKVMDVDNRNVLAYVRQHSGDDPDDYVVLINFSDEAVTCETGMTLQRQVVSTHARQSPAAEPSASGQAASAVELLPHEAVIYVGGLSGQS